METIEKDMSKITAVMSVQKPVKRQKRIASKTCGLLLCDKDSYLYTRKEMTEETMRTLIDTDTAHSTIIYGASLFFLFIKFSL